MSDNNNGNNGFLSGLILGAILGGVLGVVYAPQAGETTRKWIKEVKDQNEDIIKDAMDNSANLVQTTKDSIEEGFHKLTKTLESKQKSKK